LQRRERLLGERTPARPRLAIAGRKARRHGVVEIAERQALRDAEAQPVERRGIGRRRRFAAMTASARAQSATVRAIGPTESSV